MTGFALGKLPAAQSETQAKQAISEAIRATAAELGNTVAICRKCYVHPRVLESYRAGKLAAMLER